MLLVQWKYEDSQVFSQASKTCFGFLRTSRNRSSTDLSCIIFFTRVLSCALVFLFIRIKKDSIFLKNVDKCWSNNHLIPCDENIKRLLNEVKYDDCIRIEGYFVEVVVNDHGQKYLPWRSSLVRTDHRCEIIYVTNITWLEEEK